MFVSSQDIAKGARGLDIIGQHLETTNFGLLVLTQDNASSPWINFEAGALSKSLVHGHVIPLLCGITEVNIPTSPLRQFQHAKMEREEMLRVVQDINQACARPLADDKIAIAFEKWWPDFLEGYKQINLKPAKPQREKDPAELADTVLEALGSLMSDVSSLRGELGNQRQFLRRLERSERIFPKLSSGHDFHNAIGRFGTDDNRSLGDILGDALKQGDDK